MRCLPLPGLIDGHVHLRDPGATHKEDFSTGTAAALAGGVVAVLDMPNNTSPTVNGQRLSEKAQIASEKARCDFGFYLGATEDNVGDGAPLSHRVAGLKIYITMRVPVSPASARSMFSRLVMIASLPPASRNQMMAWILGNILPGAKWPSSIYPFASATVI